MEIIKQYTGTWIYPLVRMMTGILFLLHGAIKFKWFTDFSNIASIFGIAGVLEVIIGLALILGVYVRLAALVGIVEMAVAIGMMHRVLNPLATGGWELPMLFICLFAVFVVYGAQAWSLEKHMSKKEYF
ncbi:MAG: DoxX family protein [Candidatus Woesearchaeota archaeon]